MNYGRIQYTNHIVETVETYSRNIVVVVLIICTVLIVMYGGMYGEM